ncbi:MAG: chaperone NapD [Bacteroidota bacterium]
MNLSSIVVQVNPSHLDEVIEVIQKSDLWEYQLHDEKGRIIVVIEGKDTEEEVAKLQELQAVKYVSSAEMAFSYSGDELEEARQFLAEKEELPNWLNDPDAKLSEIKYGGDIKGRF